MTSSITNLDTLHRDSRNAVQEGFAELERYLRTMSVRSIVLIPEERAQGVLSRADDPARVGLDRLERTIQAARLNANRVS